MNFDSKPEILAPVGTFEAVSKMFDAGADAVYLGGKRLNMRMKRAGFNLTDEELDEAIRLAHGLGKRLYVTLNSLVLESEMGDLQQAVETLGRLGPDAIIVQDLAVAATVRRLCPAIPLHASTMMNVHSAETARVLKGLGFTRIIASRDIPLSDVRRIGEGSGLEMEYFVHGDMCIAQSSLCTLGGIVFGESSNRGRCMKPCRWPWRLVDDRGRDVPGAMTEGRLLARKDMCMLQHVPDLVHAGVVSLKIEGRMRPPEFTGALVAAYRRAVDAYFADPAAYATDAAEMDRLLAMRVRDLTTCHALANPGARSVDPSGAREPQTFSSAKAEPALTLPGDAGGEVPAAGDSPLIAHVATQAAAAAALDAGATAVYLGGDVFLRYPSDVDADAVARLTGLAAARGARLAVLGPQISEDRDLAEWQWHLERALRAGPVGVGVSSLGALAVARRMGAHEIVADFAMNVCNSAAADRLRSMGVSRVTASIELTAADVLDLRHACPLPVEIIGQGPLRGMLLDHCIVAAATGHTPQDVCPMACRRGGFALRDDLGQDHRIECDRRCRNHLYAARDVCVLPNLAGLLAAGPVGIRIEAQFDSPGAVAEVVSAYRQALDALARGESFDAAAAAERIARATGRPQGDGPFAFSACRNPAQESADVAR